MDLTQHITTTAMHLGICAAIFAVLTRFWPCNADIRWWNLRSLAVDLCYWLIVPVVMRYARLLLLAGGVALVYGLSEVDRLPDYLANGFGPVGELNFYVQVALALVITDVACYWIHRIFHGRAMWRFHAIHHSSEHLDWISSARFHPVNVILGSALVEACLLLAGFSPLALAFLGPFNIVMNAFVHANLNWTLGPFRYVIATPVFHRWHHTASDAGGEKNFAPTFPVIDLVFGTFYMPEGKLPEAYGVDDKDVPEDFADQMLYPFKRPRPAAATVETPPAPRVDAPPPVSTAADERAWRQDAAAERRDAAGRPDRSAG